MFLLPFCVFISRSFGVPLQPAQHTALMTIYDGLSMILFCWSLFWHNNDVVDCPDVACPRFASSDECPTDSRLVCLNGSVERLYGFFVFVLLCDLWFIKVVGQNGSRWHNRERIGTIIDIDSIARRVFREICVLTKRKKQMAQ